MSEYPKAIGGGPSVDAPAYVQARYPGAYHVVCFGGARPCNMRTRVYSIEANALAFRDKHNAEAHPIVAIPR